MLLTTVTQGQGEEAGRSITFCAAHFATPVTVHTCHYFWSFARDFRTGETALDEQIRAAVDNVFRNEDAAMIERVQRNMGTETDFLSTGPGPLRPVILPTDQCAIRARTILRSKIKKEEGAVANATAD